MGIKLYKPTKANKGALAHFSFKSKNDNGDGEFYISIVKQTGYDSARNLGSFKEGEKGNFKFNQFEIGGLLRAIRSRSSVKFYHKTPSRIVSINFGPYYRKDEAGVPTLDLLGFGLSFNVQTGETKNDFRISISLDEAEVLKEYIVFVLGHFFSAIYSQDKEFFNKLKNKSDSPRITQKKQESSPEAVVENDDPLLY